MTKLMKKNNSTGLYEKWVNAIWVLLKFITFTPSGTVREIRLRNFVASSSIIFFRPLLKTFFHIQWKKTSDLVEKKYDELSGSYIHRKYYGGQDGKKFYYVNNRIKKITYGEQTRNQMNEYFKIISENEFKTILEVGAGELTTLGSLADLFGNDIDYYALDLSLNRVYQGREDFLKRHSCAVEVCKANAAALPYPDKFFDVVFTSHCLEHMPYDYKKAIDEMCRVARKAVILFEPSYELGTFSQKLRMTAKDYVRGIPKYVNSLNTARLSAHFFLKSGALFNRTACHLIEVVHHAEAPETKQPFKYVCPACRSDLAERDNCLVCQNCSKIYFIFEEIPLLDDKYSFYIGNRYKKIS